MPITDWLPLVDEIAAVSPRTKDEWGNAQTTFTLTTNPTLAQVLELRDQAAHAIASRVGFDLTGQAASLARNLAAVGAAMLIELRFFPEQVRSERSPYSEWQSLYARDLAGLIEAVSDLWDDGVIDAGNDGMPVYSFPPTVFEPTVYRWIVEDEL